MKQTKDSSLKSEIQYPLVNGMDAILLTLTLKHKCVWMSIYNSLQEREDLDAKEVIRQAGELKLQRCGYISLIDNDYPSNLKSIYQPPFGIFYKGDVNLIKADNAVSNTITVIGDCSSALRAIKPNENVIWVNKTNEEIQKILESHPVGNIFYGSEFKNFINKPNLKDNCFISEIWEKDFLVNEGDHSYAAEERLYLGITKSALICKGVDANKLKAIQKYASQENIELKFNN